MLPAGTKKILLIQLGDIGDVVWMTPTLWAVKEACPAAEVSLLVRGQNGTLLEADPAVGKIFTVEHYEGGRFERLRRQILFLEPFRRERFDVVIDLRSDERGAVMSRLSGAPVRIAQYYKEAPFWRRLCFTHLVHPPPRERGDAGAAEQSLRIVRELGVATNATIPRLYVQEDVQKGVSGLLKREGIETGRFVSLNPFSRWSYKELAVIKWQEIIAWLWREFGLAAVIVGAEAERGKAEVLTRGCKGDVYNLAGKTSLNELAALLNLSRLHVGVDSAAPHIAAAVGTPTVTVYGPSDWREWAPPGAGNLAVIADGDCVPCRRKGCDDSGISRCLETFPPDKIKPALRETLQSDMKTP